MDQLRSNLPEIANLTYADKFVLSYIFTSLLPVYQDADRVLFLGLTIKTVYVKIHELVMVTTITTMLWKWFFAWKILGQEPPKQIKEKGGKKAPDASW